MTTLRPALLSCLAITLAVCPVAAEHWIVPAGANATGQQDTNWRTDLQLVNPTGNEVTVRLYLLRKNQDNSDLSESTTHTVPADGQTVVGDVFFSDFSYSGTGGLLVECGDPNLVVTSRTYNLLDDGRTYGQFIPGVKLAHALPASYEGHIIYLAKSDEFRSNLGFCAASAAAGAATVRMYDENGVQTGSATRNYGGFGQFQWNDIFSVTGSAPSTAARAVIVATTPIVAYGSVVDERTGDPVAVMAERYGDIAFGESAIAASARGPGAEGSMWHTDIRIFNPTDSSVMVSMGYYPKRSNNGPQNNTTYTVGPASILALDDAMLEAFGLSEANGAIRIAADQPIMVWSRTYNQSDEGTYGQSIPAGSTDFSLDAGEVLVYTGLSNTGFRSNVGFFNLEDDDVVLSLTMVDATGTQGTARNYALGPNEMDQINDVFDWIGLPANDGAYYSLEISGENDALTFVSVIDNLSNDPVYQPGEIRTAGGGGGGGGGGGNCITVPAITAGTDTAHNISGFEEALGQLLPYTGELTTTYIETTPTSISSETHSELSVTVGGGTVEATADAVIDLEFHEVDDPAGYRGLDRDTTHLEYVFMGNTTVSDTIISYSPAKIQGPSTTWCDGETWTSPSVTVTTVVDGETQPVEQSPTDEGVVHSVDEVLTVPAGTFTTVKYTVTITSGDGAGATDTTWLDVATGITVKQEVRDQTGLLIRFLSLRDLQ